MPNNKWDDEHIENLLKDFPTIKDERPKEEVYQLLKKDSEPKRKSNRWIPVLVAALAFITFGILLASMLGQQSNDSASDMTMSGSESSESSTDTDAESAADNAAEESTETESSDAMESTDSAETEEEGSEEMESVQEETSYRGASVYGDELGENRLFRIGLTENALVVPVSFLISDEKLEEDFGKTDVDAVELYNRYAAELDEEALGFDEYHPFIGSISMSSEGVEHILPDDHSYDMASASMSVYFNSLSASFNDATEIAIVNQSGDAAEFDQIGPIEPIDPSVRNTAYYSYTTPNGSIHLVPGYDMPQSNAVEALEEMKASPNDLYSSLIPADLDYTVTETEEIITVEFNQTIDFDSYDYQEMHRMIEGMILAADSFDKELMIDNITADSWDRFDFSQSLPVPAGINLMEFNN